MSASFIPSRIYVYCRVSSEQQDERTLSLDQQFNRALELIQEQGWGEITVKRTNEVSSAYKEIPPRLKGLVHSMIEGSVLLVTTVDRFSRSVRLGTCLLHELSQKNCRLVSANENYDSMSSSGRHTISILLSSAELSSATLSDKVRQSLRRLRDQGNDMGPAPYGMKVRKEVDERGRLISRRFVANPEEQKIINFIVRLYGGITAREATQLLYQIIPQELQAPIHFWDGDDEVDEVRPQGLSYSGIASLLSDYSVMKRDFPWTGSMVKEVLKRAQALEGQGVEDMMDGLVIVEEKEVEEKEDPRGVNGANHDEEMKESSSDSEEEERTHRRNRRSRSRQRVRDEEMKEAEEEEPQSDEEMVSMSRSSLRALIRHEVRNALLSARRRPPLSRRR